MAAQGPRRLDRDTAERLLDGDVAALARVGELAAPLRAARGPVHPDELVGEQAALEAFRGAADLDPAGRATTHSTTKILLAKLLSIKAAAVLAASGVGGLLLAAGAGTLTGSPNLTPPSPSASAGTVPHTPAGATTTPPRPDVVPDHSGSITESTVRLCQAYLASPPADPRTASESPAFTGLIVAAGGHEHVAEYCRARVAVDPSADAVPHHPVAPPSSARRATSTPVPDRSGDVATRRPDIAVPQSSADRPTAAPVGAPTAPGQ